jgi:curved DNA-binding protein CbpA
MIRNKEMQTYYELLGVPIGASVDHIKDSYRLLTKRNSVTDNAYQVLTDPARRREYDSQLKAEKGSTESSTREEGTYCVVHDDTGWHVVEDSDVGWELESLLPNRIVRLKAPKLLFGPFSKTEAEEFAAEKRRGNPAP